MKFFYAFLISITLDQVTKWLAQRFFTVQYNSGISLSWLKGADQYLLSLLLCIFLIGIAWTGEKIWKKYPGWSGMFFGGAVSNLLDRMLYSGVRDWITLPVIQLKNNIADWFICVSLGFILFQLMRQKRGENAN